LPTHRQQEQRAQGRSKKYFDQGKQSSKGIAGLIGQVLLLDDKADDDVASERALRSGSMCSSPAAGESSANSNDRDQPQRRLINSQGKHK